MTTPATRPEHRDPFAAAGVIWCAQHRTEVWPADATWLDTNLVLADFPDSCCTCGAVRIVDPSQLKRIADRCEGITAADMRCRSRPLRDSNLCHWHQSQQADRKAAS